MPLLGLLGLGAGLINSVGKIFKGNKQEKEAGKIHPIFDQYTTSPYATQRLGIAKNLFNARMFGAPQLERNLMTAGANFNAGIDRNATDSATSLALKTAGLGTTNQSLEDLQLREDQNKYGLLNNLNDAYSVMTQEGTKEYESKLQKFFADIQQKQSLLNAGAMNKFGGMNDLSSGLIQADQLFPIGKKWFKGGMGGGLGGGLKPAMNFGDFQKD